MAVKNQRPYWYRDNWHGKQREFAGLRAAVKAAKSETGASVAIYDATGKFVKFADASGYCPP
jgi:hypothetical protein